jgi:hypothetical protein
LHQLLTPARLEAHFARPDIGRRVDLAIAHEAQVVMGAGLEQGEAGQGRADVDVLHGGVCAD